MLVEPRVPAAVAPPAPRQRGLRRASGVDRPSRRLRLSVFALLYLFSFAMSALADGATSPASVEGPLVVACDDEVPAMVLMVEVTIPGLFDRKKFRFPLKHEIAFAPGESIHICAGGHSENGDGWDASGKFATYYGASVSLDRIRVSSARVDLSFYWKTSTAKGEFNRRLSVPLFEPRTFTMRHGVVVRTFRG